MNAAANDCTTAGGTETVFPRAACSGAAGWSRIGCDDRCARCRLRVAGVDDVGPRCCRSTATLRDLGPEASFTSGAMAMATRALRISAARASLQANGCRIEPDHQRQSLVVTHRVRAHDQDAADRLERDVEAQSDEATSSCRFSPSYVIDTSCCEASGDSMTTREPLRLRLPGERVDLRSRKVDRERRGRRDVHRAHDAAGRRVQDVAHLVAARRPLRVRPRRPDPRESSGCRCRPSRRGRRRSCPSVSRRRRSPSGRARRRTNRWPRTPGSDALLPLKSRFSADADVRQAAALLHSRNARNSRRPARPAGRSPTPSGTAADRWRSPPETAH